MVVDIIVSFLLLLGIAFALDVSIVLLQGLFADDLQSEIALEPCTALQHFFLNPLHTL